MDDKKRDQSAPGPDRDIGAIPIAGAPAAEPVRLAPPPPSGAEQRRTAPWHTRLGSAALALVGLLVAYLFFSQFLAALFLPRLLGDSLSRGWERPVTIARAQWQPLTATMILHNGIVGPRLSDPHDRVDPLLSFRTLRAQLKPSALFHAAPWLERLELEQPFLHLLRDEGGDYNLDWIDPKIIAGNWRPREIVINNGRLKYSDRGYRHPVLPTTSPREFRGEVQEINGSWRLLSAESGSPLFQQYELEGSALQGATVKLQGRIAPRNSEDPGKLHLTITGLPLPTLTDYLHPLLGREIAAGFLSLQTEFEPLTGGGLFIDQRLEIQGLELGRTLEQYAGKGDPLLLQALLSDREQQIKLRLPITIRTALRDSPYLRELAEALDNLLERAALDPLELLAAEYPELATQLEFAPGSAELGREGEGSLDRLAALLNDRPLLGLEINAPFPSDCDREALREQAEERIAEQRRQLVATLAREVTTGSEITLSAARLAALRPGNVMIGEGQLLELATARHRVAQERLLMALEPGTEHSPATARLQLIPPAPAPQPIREGESCGLVSLKLRPWRPE